MEVSVRRLATDSLERNHIAVSEADSDSLYEHNLLFWTTRVNDETSAAERQRILDGQTAEDDDYTRATTQKLAALCREHGGTRRFSMLEIGAANGTAVKRLLNTDDNLSYDYVGLECLPFLVDDFHANFPQHTMRVGDIDDFIAMDKDAFVHAPFSLFHASSVFMMIKPALARQGLAKAATLSDEFLIYDFIEEFDAPLPPSTCLVLQMNNRAVFWFVHPWAAYLEEIGYEIVERQIAEIPPQRLAAMSLRTRQSLGVGFIHARRR